MRYAVFLGDMYFRSVAQSDSGSYHIEDTVCL